ncbi:MAG: hypothetical protein ACLQU0_11520, partial [Syntrophobacteraceae bacterium]
RSGADWTYVACGDAYSGDPKLNEGPPSPKDRARTGRMACGDAYSGDPKLNEGPPSPKDRARTGRMA